VPVMTQSSAFADDLKAFAALPEVTPALLPAVTTISQAEYAEIKVKKGDVLEKIAKQHRTTVDQIIALNKLPSTNLRIGQTLKIPQGKSSTATPAIQTAQNAASSASKYYVVKNGDNPWTIAVKNHMKVDELLKLNNLDQEKARKLKPGDKLLIQ
jgi:peptidoglycan DL-endopeptidase LytF